MQRAVEPSASGTPRGANLVESSDIIPVILCGGNGTRLWPRSRASKPKPFLPLVGDVTLFEQAVQRCPNDGGFATPVVVTGRNHLAHVKAQLGSKIASVIVEPSARNTAAAIALAAIGLPSEAVMLICPSDHHIGDPIAFGNAARRAAMLAEDGWLVAFGIGATGPETGYGYLRQGAPIETTGFRVAQFIEKPTLALAQQYIAQGGYHWNGGIFAFTAGNYLSELEKFRPDILAACKQSVALGRTEDRSFYPDSDAFNAIDGESIDYAVMEKTDRAAMVPVDMQWSDIGNWFALHEARDHDDNGNSVVGPADIIDCRNVMIDSDGPRVSVIGLENVIVVVDGGEVLVCSVAGAQRVGKLPGAVNQ
jgi:mannose-1-phosphate guanylyltransferase/mannose-1-phosphate guanylyltransferase/mannose-6-phosphate isomerase